MVKAEINRDVLKWAIDRLNVNIDIIKNNFPKIDKWLEGEELPTFRQLENLSQKLFVPFGAFFTSKPPEGKLPIPFFRTLPSNILEQCSLKFIWHKHKISKNLYQEVARHFKVSEIVVARRAFDIGFIKKNEFLAFYDNYLKKEKKKAKGGDFYAMGRFSETVYSNYKR